METFLALLACVIAAPLWGLVTGSLRFPERRRKRRARR